MGNEQLAYAERLEAALGHLLTILNGREAEETDLQELIGEALKEEVTFHDKLLEPQTYGDAVLHGSTTGRLKVSLQAKKASLFVQRIVKAS